MTATIVRINAKVKHPDADTLTIYKVSNDLDIELVQVVANQENVYEVGGTAVYIHSGSVLHDGTKISKRKLRGIMSYGMLAGHSDKPVGLDVTGYWCQEEPEPIEVQRTNLKHQKWPSIESFAHVKRSAYKLSQMSDYTPKHEFNCTYGGKIKLHGTNAAVQISPDGEVVAQKRSSVIYPDQDNVGFANWVAENKEAFAKLALPSHITLHGEWCGPKIQKGVAVSELPRKVFAIFSVQYGLNNAGANYLIEPEDIKEVVGEGPWYILDWYHKVDINFLDALSTAAAANEIELKVLEVEAKDPWAYENFGIEGIGEGLVYYPINSGLRPADWISQFIFKAKGYKHQSNSNKTPNLVPVDIEKLKSVEEFVVKFITPSRLEQGVIEGCNGQYETKLIGQYLKWIGNDVQKESVAELEESELTWKDIAKPLATRARMWYQGEIAKR